jgi:DNA-binding transcriptional regulator YhcF (GntR family)
MFFNSNSSLPIYKQISAKIIVDIEEGILKTGDALMSINEFSNEHEIARDTVEKAYKMLKEKGIIRSVKGKGYFVTHTQQMDLIRIFLHFNKLSTYKKKIYDSFIEHIGYKGNIELFIHHDSNELFINQMESAYGNYEYYVVIPPDGTDKNLVNIALRKINKGKLLILDKWQDDFQPTMAVYQNFENDIVNALQKAKDLLFKYRKLTLVFPKTKGYAKEVMVGFSKFCAQNEIEFDIISDIQENKVNKGKAFVVIEEEDLVAIIKIIQQKKMKLGNDIGIISYNDTPLKEVLSNGITVISTDFVEMGKNAADLILGTKKGIIQNDFRLIVRNSL